MSALKKSLWTTLFLTLGLVSIVGAGPAGDGSQTPGSRSDEQAEKLEEDIIKTKTGDLKITFIGHGTLMFSYNGKVIHVDPWSRLADYSKLPKADLILVTHEHADHLDTKAIGIIRQEQTKVVLTKACAAKVPGGNGGSLRRFWNRQSAFLAQNQGLLSI